MGAYTKHSDSELFQERKNLEREIASMAENIEKAENELMTIAQDIDSLGDTEVAKRMALESQREERNLALGNWSNQRNEFQKRLGEAESEASIRSMKRKLGDS